VRNPNRTAPKKTDKIIIKESIEDSTISPDKNFSWSSLWQVVSLFVVVLLLELVTPVDYVFGYLYTGPILISASRLGRKATFYATLVAVLLTILNLWFPGNELVKASTLASRIIASIALIVTGILSDRNRRYEQAIAAQQVQLQSQAELARVREDFASTLTHDLKTPLLGASETLKAWEQGKFGTVTPTHYKILEKIDFLQKSKNCECHSERNAV
jgi:two-component system NarL family sensor kinase